MGTKKNNPILEEFKNFEMENNDKKNNDEFKTGKGDGLRYNKGKLRYDLVNPLAHRDMVKVLTYGANKYFDRNWENGLSWTSVLASLKRHISAFEMGEDYDKETGLLHIAHAACNLHFLNTFYYTFPQGDDRPKMFLKQPNIGLDVDGVLADFATAWSNMFPEVSATPNSWYFDRKIGERFNEMRNNNTLNDFYLNIPVLTKPEDIPFDPCCYITSRPVPVEITEQWLCDNGFPAKPVYSINVRESKVSIAAKSGIDIFVDDSYENFVDLNNNGIFTYLYSAPWNNKYDVGHMRIKSLKDIPLVK